MQWLSFIGLAAAGLFPLVNPLGAVPLFASLTQDYSASEQRRQALRSAMFAFAILGVSLLVGNAILAFFDLSLGMLQIAGGLIVGHTGWQMSTGQPRLSQQDVRELHHRGFKRSVASATTSIVSTVTHLPKGVSQLAAKDRRDATSKTKTADTSSAKGETAATGATSHPGDVSSSEPPKNASADVSFSPMAMPMLAGPGAIGVTIGLAAQATTALDTVGAMIGIGVIAVLAAICLLTAGAINARLGPTGIDAMTRIFGFIVLAIAVALVANGLSGLFGIPLHGSAG